MKTILTLLAAVVLLTGCKTHNSTVQPALLRLGVSTSAGYTMMKYPEAVPGVRAGASVICAVAQGTNVNPATVVAAINAYGTLSPESVLVLNAAIGAYTLTFNGLADTNDVAKARPYTQAVCDGLNDALLIVPDVLERGGAVNFNWVPVEPEQVPGWPLIRID